MTKIATGLLVTWGEESGHQKPRISTTCKCTFTKFSLKDFFVSFAKLNQKYFSPKIVANCQILSFLKKLGRNRILIISNNIGGKIFKLHLRSRFGFGAKFQPLIQPSLN
jgi:hypothetical protein